MSPLELATLVAQSAAKAVGGMAVRASAPAWKAAARRLRPAPALVRKSPHWAEVKLAKTQEATVSSYLNGRLCIGLLEIYAFLEITDEIEDAERERERLGESFTAELSEKLDLPADQTRRIATALWADLCDCVRLHVRQLRDENAFTDEDLVYATGLLRGAPEQSPLASAVAARWALSSQRQRVASAHAAIRLIRQAMRARYAKLVMPHSREDHQVPIEQIYVDRLLIPRPDAHYPNGLADRANDLTPIAENDLHDRRFVVVGHPGAGKSTFIRYLLYRVAGQEGESASAPMVVELKDHPSPTDSYLSILAENMRVVAQAEFDTSTVRDVLRLGLAVVVFDGLDEIIDIEKRRETVTAIEMFCRRYPLVTVVVTSREEGYLRARLDPALFPVYRLPDFTDEQLRHYVERWFTIVADQRLFKSGERARNFLEDSVHVDDLRTNPLMLSLLCMIYEYEGYIPENRPQVYEECAVLLFERWDRVRRVPISFKSNSRTRYLVQELAYNFFNNDGTRSGLPEGKLKLNIKDYFQRNVVDDAESAAGQAQDFLDFCAGRAWLLAQTGTSARGERLFGFTHRTFLEYFAACFIVRHCDSARDLVGMIRPMIQFNTSEVVPQIAIQQFDARRADGIDDCLELLVTDHGRRIHLDFALRSLQFMRPTPRVLERLYTTAIKLYGRGLDPQLPALLLAGPRDAFPIVRRSCAKILAGEPATESAIGAAVVDELFALVDGGLPPTELTERLPHNPEDLRPLLAGLTSRLGADHPEVLAGLCRRRLVAAEPYVETLGARALVSVPSPGRADRPGPLVALLRKFFSAGELDLELHDMLARLAEEPSSVVPLCWPVVADLVDLGRPLGAAILSGRTEEVAPLSPRMRPMFDDKAVLAELLASDELADDRTAGVLDEPHAPFETGVVREHFPVGPGQPTWSTGFYLLFIATMLAAYEQDTWRRVELSGGWRLIAARLPLFGDQFRGRAHFNKSTGQLELTHSELASCVLEFVPTLGCAPTWQAWFRDWSDGTTSALRR